MGSFEGNWLETRNVGVRTAGLLREIGEHKGRSELYASSTLRILETLRNMTVEQSAAASSRMEGIKSSREEVNYRQLLLHIQEEGHHIELSADSLLQFHRQLYAGTDRDGGAFKAVDNQVVATRPDGTRFVSFRPVSAAETPTQVEFLCKRYQETQKTVDPILRIGAFLLDLLCIRPFLEGNARIAQLAGIWLLNKEGYNISRFVSLERMMDERKAEYYYAIHRSSQDWHEGRHDLGPWWNYWGEILWAAYNELTRRVQALSKRRGVKTVILLQTIQAMNEGFTARQMQQAVPGCGIELIRKTLKAEKAAGRVKCLGRGPNAMWIKVERRKRKSVL